MLIKTRFIPCTDYKGFRISVSCVALNRRIIVAWDYAINPEENHKQALREFLRQVWEDAPEFIGAASGDAFYWVRSDSRLRT